MKILLVASLIVIAFATEIHASEHEAKNNPSVQESKEEKTGSIDRELAAMREADANKGTTTETTIRRERRPVGKQNY